MFVCITALLLLYDVTNKVSFDNIRAWLSEIRDYANDQVVIMLIGISIYIYTYPNLIIILFSINTYWFALYLNLKKWLILFRK